MVLYGGGPVRLSDMVLWWRTPAWYCDWECPEASSML